MKIVPRVMLKMMKIRIMIIEVVILWETKPINMKVTKRTRKKTQKKKTESKGQELTQINHGLVNDP